jgi:hypothetical protein
MAVQLVHDLDDVIEEKRDPSSDLETDKELAAVAKRSLTLLS